jgi:FAD/FMN-containing dehydrogenase
VGAIPYFLGGGASIVTSTIGYGSDQILSARFINAKGDIVDITEDKEPDLLWALRGAGQFFGLVTELVVKAHPFTKLGNDQGHLWAGAFVFPLNRTAEVASVMEELINDSRHATAGLMMIMAPPPQQQPALVVAARYTGSPDGARTAYGPLYDLQPLVANIGPVPIQNISDGREAFNAKGDFKRFATVGLHRFDKAAFLQVVELWQGMIEECPDAITTSFNFQWDSRLPPAASFKSSNSLHDIRLWQNNFVWFKDAASRQKVDGYNDKAINLMRGKDRSEYVDFQNATRTGPIEHRFRGDGILEKLRALKQEWDPYGVFSNQLLEDSRT